MTKLNTTLQNGSTNLNVDMKSNTTEMNVSVENNTTQMNVQVTNGATGKSAYQAWLDDGNSGTITQFLNSLKANANMETYIHNQIASQQIWVINHRLNRYPSCTIVDTGNNVVVGEITYQDKNNTVVKFTSEFSGKAYLN